MRARLPTLPAARTAWADWWRRWGGVARQSGVAIAVALIAYLVCFPIARPVTLDVGRFPDRLVIVGFNGDERDNGVTYRWTRTNATFAIPGYGGVRKAHIEVVARNGRDARAGTPFTVDIGGGPATVGAFAQFNPVLADVDASGTAADLTVRLRAERYVPNNADSRVLGVQVNRIRVEPVRVSWWAGAVGGWPWALRLALFALIVALVVRVPWRGVIGGACAAVVALAAVAVPESRFILPPLLVPMMVGIGALGVGWHWRETGATLGSVWNALDRRVIARAVVGTLVVVYALCTFAVIQRVDFIGHADYADNAVRAANIVRGHGDVIDYVPQFYQRLPTITHPAETWPPLQVWMIAAFFRVFGISTVVAKLPNVVVMGALIALVAAVGAWRWSRRVGMLAALFLVATPILFEDTLFPVNDLVFSLLFAVFVVAVYRAWCAPPPAAARANPAWWRAWLPDVAVGASAGCLLLAKPSGGVLIAGAAVAAWLVARRMHVGPQWPGIVVAGVTAALFYAPWVIRNLVTFGAPFHTTESLDAWVLKYDPKQPVEGIYGVFWGRDLPHPRLLVGYGYEHFLSVQGHQFAKLWSDATSGALLPRLLIPFMLLGLIVGASRQSAPGFGLVLAGAFVPYTLFVLLYWHDESRYFLVFMPWLLLYAASGIEWTYDALVTWFAGMWQRALVPIFAALLLLGVLIPDARDIAVRVQAQTGGNEIVVVSDWLKTNTPPDAVIMTRNPWEVSWHSGRRAVMLPLGSLDDVYAVMRQYHVTYLELDHLNDPSTLRESLKPLYSFKAMPGITPLYDPHNDA
ncbi:MAG: glycosyltransferase family 39 protein, partial [Chloroflexota bacterium]|nr:glycosyltransferase family 39 protein [Chloroflexota bacterium]